MTRCMNCHRQGHPVKPLMPGMDIGFCRFRRGCRRRERRYLASYPHLSGGFTVIGPECFAAGPDSDIPHPPSDWVLCWRGQNSVPQGGSA